MVTVYLAEADRRPEGAIPLFARVFALEGEGPEVLSLGEDPVLGEVRARALLRGEARDLSGHPVFRRAGEVLARAYVSTRAQGQREAVRDLEERARRLALQEALERVRAKAEELERVGIALRAAQVPANFLGEGFGVGQPPTFQVSTLEEAERVAQAYNWARRVGVRLLPLPRGRNGEIRFAAPLLYLQAENGEAKLPVRGRGPYRVSRRERGVVLEGVGFPPRGVQVIYLPW